MELGWICCAVSVVGGEDDTTAATLLPGSDEVGAYTGSAESALVDFAFRLGVCFLLD